MRSDNWQPNRIEQRAADILQAIRTIHTYLAKISREDFLKDHLRQDGVARQLLIISEACDKIPEIEKTREIPAAESMESRHPNIPWRLIRNMGIVIRHVYGEEDPAIIWDTATGTDLIDLKRTLLADFPFLQD